MCVCVWGGGVYAWPNNEGYAGASLIAKARVFSYAEDFQHNTPGRDDFPQCSKRPARPGSRQYAAEMWYV